VQKLTTNVPVISKAVNIKKFSTVQGSNLRIGFLFFSLVPFWYMFDQNQGVMTLGFQQSATPLER